MTSHLCQRLTSMSKLLLTVGSLSSVAVPRIFSQTPMTSQAPSQENRRTATQAFEVATIKPVENGPKTPRFIKLEGTNRFVVRDYNLKLLIAAAYNMNSKSISGGPSWVESNYYDIVAIIPGLPNPTREAQMAMLQTLLEDRFHLKYHREPKELPIYALGVAKNGPKLKATSLSSTDAVTVGPGMVYPQKVVLPARNATMSDFVALLQRAVLDRPVMDVTGLTGRYDFSLEFAPDERQFRGELPPASDDAPTPPLFRAVQEQLGLTLEARKGTVASMVIDQTELPSPN